MYYPSFYTTPQYYSFATDDTAGFGTGSSLSKTASILKDKGITLVTPTPGGNFVSPPKVTNDAKPFADRTIQQIFKEDKLATDALGGALGAVGGAAKNAIGGVTNIIFDPCKFLGISADSCKYAPYIMLGVGALLVYALLKWII